jgi:phosphate starvation-inducible PhoH-like protein
MVEPEKLDWYLAKQIIEIAPLAFMRGRTLSDAFIILDEAQNTTSEQMKMFLTRMGYGSKVVVNGDITQIDLPIGKESGLIEALEYLEDVPEVGILEFSTSDVVRHDLVQKVINAYEKGIIIRNSEEIIQEIPLSTRPYSNGRGGEPLPT